MKAQHLPLEIYLKFFENLLPDYRAKRYFMNCILVCKSWSDAALQMLYKEIKPGGTRILKLRKCLFDNSAQHPFIQHGQLVHKLEITYDDECDGTKQIWNTLKTAVVKMKINIVM